VPSVGARRGASKQGSPVLSKQGSRRPSKQPTAEMPAAEAAPQDEAHERAHSRGSISVPTGMTPEMRELLETIAARADGSIAEGFSRKEIDRMQTAFGRFKIPGESDLYVTDVADLLAYLGHVITQEEQVMAVVRQITTYDYMDFDEFLTFMGKFIEFEREEFRKVYDEYDEDGSGEISIKELRALTKALGFVPLRQMVNEALAIVDADGNGQLSFDELCTFLAVYQHAEGFTRAEVNELRAYFDRFSVSKGVTPGGRPKPKVLPPEALSDALVQVFGLQVAPFTRIMGEKLSSGQGLQKSTFDKGGEEPESLHFPEFLIFARKLREEVFYKQCKEHPRWAGHHLSKLGQSELGKDTEAFQKFDSDKSGGISEQELRKVLISRDYTPLRCVLDEILDEVYEGDWDPETSELDFEEFFDFMLIYDQRDGFTVDEAAELRKVYDRFDEDGSGEVSAMECADLFRYVGYRVTLDDLREHVCQVDENSSGQLDFREFLRLMRLYREKELKKIRSVFNCFKDEGTDSVHVHAKQSVLGALGHDSSIPPSLDDVAPWTFDALVDVVDSCRTEYVNKERKKAGFSDMEIAYFHEIYEKFDTNKNGEIDNLELQAILKEFNWEPKSREQQLDLMSKLDQARALAREAGVHDVGPDGSPFIKFWSFVQLARMLRTQTEKEEEAALRDLQVELRFAEGEVEDFRQIFRGWVRKSYELEAKRKRPQSDNVPETLPRDTVKRLVRSLGVSISPANSEKLDGKIKELDEFGRLESAELNFFSFLYLMRWILDTDFAGVNDAAAKQG